MLFGAYKAQKHKKNHKTETTQTNSKEFIHITFSVLYNHIDPNNIVITLQYLFSKNKRPH